MILALSALAYAAELEVLVYNANTGTDLVAQQYQQPVSMSWPVAYSVLTSGTVRVYQASAAAGKTRFCVDFRASSASPWHTSCSTADNANDQVFGVAWPTTQFAVGIYLNTGPGFNSGQFLNSDDFSAATASCSIACDDGTSCAVTGCTNGCATTCPAACTCL